MLDLRTCASLSGLTDFSSDGSPPDGRRGITACVETGMRRNIQGVGPRRVHVRRVLLLAQKVVAISAVGRSCRPPPRRCDYARAATAGVGLATRRTEPAVGDGRVGGELCGVCRTLRRSRHRRCARASSSRGLSSMFQSMEQAHGSSVQTVERRRARRVWVAGVAVLRGGAQPPSVWRVGNLSLGGASLFGEGALTGRLAMSLHVAGFPDMELTATLVRRQLRPAAGDARFGSSVSPTGNASCYGTSWRPTIRRPTRGDARCWSSRTTSAVPLSPPSSPRSGSRCATRPLPDRRRPGCSGRARRCCWWTVASWRSIAGACFSSRATPPPRCAGSSSPKTFAGSGSTSRSRLGSSTVWWNHRCRDALARHLLGG